MFYDEARLERIRRRPQRRLTALVVAVELFLGALALLVVVGLTVFSTPEGLRVAMRRIVGDAPVDVSFADVMRHPTTRWYDPTTWRIVVKDLVVAPHDPMAPDVTLRWVVVDVPDVIRGWATRELAFEEAEVFGLRVHQHRQRPGPGWEPRETALSEIHAGTIHVYDAGYRADPDPPLLEARVDRIDGTLFDMVYAPGSRLLSGHGRLRARSFRTGGIALERVDATATSDAGDLVFDATFHVYGGHGSLHGEVDHFHRRGAVRLDVRLHGVRVEKMVESASGTAAPVTGRVDGTLVVRAGGELPRGGGFMEGDLSLTDGLVVLGDNVGGFTRDLIRIAPWVELDDQFRVVLGPTEGTLRLDRGTATLHELRYHAPKRLITIRGTVDEAGVDLVVRFVPESYAHLRPGFGVVLSGPADDIQVRLARRAELLPERYEDDTGELSRRQRRRQRREARRRGE